MGAQLSADLRHITVGTGRQHTRTGSIDVGSGCVRADEGGLLAKPRNLALENGQAGFDVIARIRHGRDPTVGLSVTHGRTRQRPRWPGRLPEAVGLTQSRAAGG